MRDEFLKECLVDPAGETESRRRMTRPRAVVAAVTFEALAILSLALYPLLTPAQLRPQIVNAPIPVRFGAPKFILTLLHQLRTRASRVTSSFHLRTFRHTLCGRRSQT